MLDIAGSWALWFATSKEVSRQTCWRSGWWVWIEVPHDSAEYLLPGGEPFQGNYRLRIEYVNGLEMMFEQGD